MIRILVHGLNFFIIIFISCTYTKKSAFSEKNRFYYYFNQPGFSYKNDSLKLGITFNYFTTASDKTNSSDYKLNAFQFAPFPKKNQALIGYFQSDYYSFSPWGVVFYQLQKNDLNKSIKKWSEYTSSYSGIEARYFDTFFDEKKFFSRVFVFKIDSTLFALQAFTGHGNDSTFKASSFELIDSLHIGNDYEKVYDNNLFNTAWKVLKKEDSLPSYSYFKKLFERNNTYYKKETSEKYVRASMLNYAYSFYHEFNKIRDFQTNFRKTEKTDLRFSPLVTVIKKNTRKKIKNYISSQAKYEDDRNKMFADIKKAQIVIINENHLDWRHRYHTTYLLDTLEKLGYHSIGIEALAHNDSVEFKEYPTLNSGFYTLEPAMANLIRTAKFKKWNLFSYDYDREKFDTISKRYPNINGREWSMAIHIMEFLQQNPNEKILIHCGFKHLFENNEQNGTMWLAEILNKFWNINPITIDQYFFDDLDIKDMPKINQSLLFTYYSKDRFLQFDSSIFQHVDYYSINSIKENEYYSSESSYTNTVVIPLKIFFDSLKIRIDCSIEVYPLKEVLNKNYLPCYLSYFSYLKNDIPPNLYLPGGKYRLYIRDFKNDILFTKEIE